MANTCRICHPRRFDAEDPDPQLSIVYVDNEEYLNKISDSDDESDGISTSDGDQEEENSGQIKKDEDGTEHHILESGQGNDNDPNTGNNSDTGDETFHHKKDKRDVNGKSFKKNRRNRRKRRGKTNNSKCKINKEKITRTTSMLMPTQEYYSIPDIVVPHWKCGKKTKLVYLGPDCKPRNREFDIVEAEMQKTIAHFDNCESAGGCFERYNVTKIQKIVQGCAWRKYQARKTDVALEAGSSNEKMLFHGTDAVWKIVSGGFDERFCSTNGQFGAGLYFAQHSSLANQFVFGYFGGNGCKRHHDKNCYICDRHLLLCRVTLGNPHQLKSIQNMPHPPPGYHSVEALAGKGAFQHPEFVIYRGEQAYPEYLITYKIVKPKEDKQDKRDSKWSDGHNSNNGDPGQAVPAGDNTATSTAWSPNRGGTSLQGRYPSPRGQNPQDGNSRYDGHQVHDGVIGPSQRSVNESPPRLDDPRGYDGRYSSGKTYSARGGGSRYDSRNYKQY